MNKGEFIPVDDKDGFIEKVAHDVVRQLTKEDKKRALEMEPWMHHMFGLGIYIRNNYIYGMDPYYGEPDDLSSEITDRVLEILKRDDSQE